MGWRNGEVVKVAPAAIMSSEDGGNEGVLFPSDEARARIPFEVLQDRLARVSRSKGKAFGPLPKGDGLLVVGRLKWCDIGHSRTLVNAYRIALNLRRAHERFIP